jgi:hypothetical protein
VTGNPRFDLLRPELRAVYRVESTNYREQFGPYVIFNMNFARANPRDFDNTRKLLLRNLGSYDEREALRDADVWHAMLRLINRVALENDVSVVVRPHPGENHAIYEQILPDVQGLHCEHVGDVRGWMAGAEAVIHSTCTTGLESALLGIPTISYVPSASAEELDNPRNRASIVVRSADDAIDLIRTASSQGPHTLSSAQRDVLDAYFTTEGPPAAEAICDVIEGLGPRGAVDAQRLHPGSRRVAEEAAKALLPPAGVAALDAVRARLGDDRGVRIRADRRQRFPGLTAAELRARIADFTPHLQIDPAAVTVRLVRFAPNTYVLSSR